MQRRVPIMKRRYTKEEGFTLLEVMTSMFIMTFSLLLLLHLAIVALDGNKWASGTTSSTQLVQAKLEDLRNVATPTSGIDTVNSIVRAWTVSTAGTHLRQVDIVATDLNNLSRTQTYTLRTFIQTATP
jgi:Tfp pilus assembly protein PilV